MLRMLCGKTLKDTVRNDEIREMIGGGGGISEFLPEQKLRWLGHVEKMDKDRKPVKALHFKLDGTKNR